MKTIFIDFDNTIVESNKRIINILNDRYGLCKAEDDLKDYGYKSIAPTNPKEVFEIYDSDEFFSSLEIKDGFIDFLSKFNNIVNITIVSKGTNTNLEKKEQWIKANIPSKVEFVGINRDDLSKKEVNMVNGIQIDDCTAALDTNAKIKILYKSGNNFDWQQNYENTDILVVNSWKEIEQILDFYLMYDYETLEKGDSSFEKDDIN